MIITYAPPVDHQARVAVVDRVPSDASGYPAGTGALRFGRRCFGHARGRPVAWASLSRLLSSNVLDHDSGRPAVAAPCQCHGTDSDRG